MPYRNNRSALIQHIIDDKYYSLFLGSNNSIEELNVLRSRNLRTIICVDKQPTTHFTSYAQYYQVNITNNENLIHTFRNVSEIIQNALKVSSVLVVCNNGLQAAPTVVIAYLISRGWQYEKAFYYVKERRNVINPSVNAKQQLMKYYESVKFQEEQDEVHKFSQVLKQLQNFQNYYEESPSFNQLTDSFQDDGIKTPGFTSPSLKMRNSIRKASIKNSMIRSTSCHQRSETMNNYSFHLDEIQENVSAIKEMESPKFIQVEEIGEEEEEELVRLRHRRHRRGLHRNKSAHQNC